MKYDEKSLYTLIPFGDFGSDEANAAFKAGKKYYGRLISGLRNIKIIMENLPIRKRLQWLKKN
jgi:hypothetical protein